MTENRIEKTLVFCSKNRGKFKISAHFGTHFEYNVFPS